MERIVYNSEHFTIGHCKSSDASDNIMQNFVNLKKKLLLCMIISA